MRKSIQIAYDELFKLKCELAAKAGFKEIAVNTTKVLDKTEDDWKQITSDIQEILDANGLKCSQSHPYYYDLLVSSEITEERYEFAMKQAIIASAKLGAEWCVFHPRTSLSTAFSVKQSFEDNKRAFSEYLEIAKKYGTGIAVENLPIFNDVLPAIPFYSSTPEDLMEFVDEFADEKLRICWDTGHANLMAFDQAEQIRRMGNRIQCTHIHNNFYIRDNHLTPDQGNIPWEKVMAAFKAIKYNGVLTLETHCCYTQPSLLASFARHNYACLSYLEELFGETK